ncbi:TRAP transporter substrate-binding protein DctP [Sedimentibacter sp.]|uniref:TRAP transporter substrate-binding protein DctP n=1 Tax=Sedimentibacter sp. TaxID=1960295 RepID=UPI0028B24DF9|nr:TRAP transporter substrate-binding protein DctP [Sedimentibacter sp.]
MEASSNGKIKVEIYPSGQLGTDRSVFEDIQNGSITGMVCNPAVEVSFVPSANIFDIPFVYDMEHGRTVLADPDFIKEINAEYEKANIRLLGVTAQGFRNLCTISL